MSRNLINKVVDLAGMLALKCREHERVSSDFAILNRDVAELGAKADRFKKLYDDEKIEHAKAKKAIQDVCDAVQQIKVGNKPNDVKIAAFVGKAAVEHDEIPF